MPPQLDDVHSGVSFSSSSKHGEATRGLVNRKNDDTKPVLELESGKDVVPRGGFGEPQVHLFGRDLSEYSPDVQSKVRHLPRCLPICWIRLWASLLARLNRAAIKTSRQTPILVPTGKFIALSILRAFDLAVTNSAMMYLNYPAKTLIKSCRVVFTMFMGVLIRKKKYKLRDYAAVFTLVIGLLIFLHADSSSAAVFHPVGVALLTLSLFCDGTLNNWSEQMMEEHQLTQDEFHSKLYFVSLIATVVAAHWQNELFPGIEYFFFRPGTVTEIESQGEIVNPTWTITRKAMALFLFGTTGIMGASCLGAITKRFGALSMALTSTGRKATTLFLSLAVFNNDCTLEHVVGVCLFMTGLMMKTLSKRKTGQKEQQQQQSAGEKPIERPKLSGQDNEGAAFLARIPIFGRYLTRNSQTEKAALLRHRSSIDMEFGLESD
ncbi:3'-phosphoadenosine 5'-phosphosulfate transmembrane transporter [Fragilaria crotonensis]|nr:3'-phosphoadenosine 5'-phosphosulfate transmembrane transporter [Fragilaria crotonensis]